MVAVTGSMNGTDSGARFLSRRATAWVAAAAAAEPTAAVPVLDLAADEVERPAAPHIIEATVAALDRGETHYTDRTGIAPLRAAVAARFGTLDDLSYEPKGEVLICGGGREALFVATQMLIEPGDEVLVVEPAPVAYAEGVRLAGGIPINVSTLAEEGFALKAEAVRARITPRTRALLFGSPATPTGGVTTGADLEALAGVARAYNLLVIWDETFREYTYGGAEQANLAALPGMRERTAIVGSFSARYAMSGWRAGYVVGPATLIRPVTLMKQALTICSPAPSQWAALAALDGPQDEADAAVREIAARRMAAITVLDRLGLHCVGAGSPFLWFDVRALGASGRAFVALAAREAAVGLRAGEDFGGSGNGWVRLTLNAPADTLTSALGRLAPLVGRLRAGCGYKGDC
ncbi:MAG TPA: aminotransferase class I/II-fold pyridoxal phosphate-dependent enzyme [Thermomicrobiales bacterium]|jgi:aminotransferase